MRAISGGHAFWYIESKAGRVLFDPVFEDPFEEGTVTACPSRTIEVSNLPEHDLLYLSHRHLDHFHLPTLKRLPKDKTVIAPADKLTLLSLKRLGFQDIRPMSPFEAHVLNKNGVTLRLIPTPSVSDTFLEYGLLVIEDVQGEAPRVLFNQVDTPLSDECIEKIKILAPDIDIHLAMFASQDFGWFQAKESRISETYSQNLYAAMQLGAKLIVPAAAGFRFTDSYDHLNKLLFPIPRERFMEDIKNLCPKSTSVPINPGDVIVLEKQMRIERQSVSYLAMKEDDSHRLTHDPTTPVPPLKDRNEGGYPLQHLHLFAEHVIEKGFNAYLQGGISTKDEKVMEHCENNAILQLKVVFPDQIKEWNFIFKEDGYQLAKGPYPQAPDSIYKITSSALIELCEGKKSCWAIRPETRRWSRLLAPRNTVVGLRTLEIELSNLLNQFILSLRIRMKGEELALLEYYGLA